MVWTRGKIKFYLYNSYKAQYQGKEKGEGKRKDLWENNIKDWTAVTEQLRTVRDGRRVLLINVTSGAPGGFGTRETGTEKMVDKKHEDQIKPPP